MGDRLFSSVVVVDQPVLIIWTISEPQLSLFNLIKDLVWFSHNSVCSGLWKEEQSELRSKGWACLIFSWDHLCNGSAVCDRFSRALAKHRRLLAEGFKLNCSLRKGRKDKEGWELIYYLVILNKWFFMFFHFYQSVRSSCSHNGFVNWLMKMFYGSHSRRSMA